MATAKGVVIGIQEERAGLTIVKVKLRDGRTREAINYQHLIGELRIGEEVLLNTTARELNLGTGGYDFVMAAPEAEERELEGPGHIMKLRYSPLQLRVKAVEEKESKWREQIENFTSLAGQLVLVASLHSMVAPAAIVLDALSNSQLKVVYIMTDAAALPLELSNSIAELKSLGLLFKTITVGQAFGGDLEAVNIYSGLIAAKEVLEADVIIVAMGPGIVGTGTEYGFTGVEQGEIINAVNILGGRAIAIPRISFADSRDRHYGLSHHTLTVLAKIALSRAQLAIPNNLTAIKKERLEEQLSANQLAAKHELKFRDGEQVLKLIREHKVQVSTMGRDERADPEFFMSVGLAALLALEELGFN